MKKKETKQKKPIYKKWWFWAILVLVFFGAAGGGEAEPDTSAVIDTAPPQVTQQETEPVDIVSLFIDRYNGAATFQIADASELDVHGDDYRVEYRLQAFNDAVGQKGTVGNGTIEIINYRDSIRVYATVDSSESAIDIISVVIGIIDETITDEEISENLSRSNNIVLGKGGSITGYLNRTNSGSYEIMVDGSTAGLMK